MTYSNGDAPVVSATTDDPIIVTNTKEEEVAPSVSADLTATKTLTGGGKTLANGQFSFEAVLKSGDAEGVDDSEMHATPTNTASGEIDFGTITFTKADTYVYEVKETSESGDGFTVDDAVYTVTYVVEQNDNELVITSTTITKKKGEAAEETAGAIVFANTYEAAPVTVKFTGAKTLKPTGSTMTGGEFEFTVTPDEHNPESGATENFATPMTNTVDGVINFGSVEYTQAGVWTYTFAETDTGNDSGILSDTTKHTVVVTVTDDAGTLKASVKIDEGTESEAAAETVTAPGINFENEQLTGTAELSVDKAMAFTNGDSEGYDTDTEYQFTITHYSGKTSETLPESNAIANESNNNRATFDPITFTEPGTYIYEIKEVDTEEANINYSDTVVYAKVYVTKNTQSKKLDTQVLYALDPNAEDAEDINTTAPGGKFSTNVLPITNTYTKPEPGKATVELKAMKTVDNAEPGENRTFNFSVTPASTNLSDGIDTTDLQLSASNNAAGQIDFGSITFTGEGNWAFTVKETSTDADGITTDKSEYTVTYNVTKNNDNTLSVDPVITKGETTVDDGIKFNNTYTAASTSVSFSGTKTLLPAGSTLTNEQFSFKLKGTSTNAASTEVEAKNDANGVINFGNLTYDTEGIYEYEVTENSTSAAGIECDTGSHTVVVEVSDNGTGNLEASVKVDDGIASEGSASGAAATGLDFTNTVLSGTATLNVYKAVTGNEGFNANEVFEFELAKGAGSDHDTDTLGATTATAKAGYGDSFGPITYTEAGTYYYTIAEQAPDSRTAGMTYDTTPKWVKVVVERNNTPGEDTLKATKIVYGATKDAVDNEVLTTNNLTITNTFGKTTYTPQVTKALVGDTAPAETYTFTLTDISSDKSGETFVDGGTTAIVSGAGTASFGQVTYTKAGDYVYEITETPGNTEGMMYSIGKVTITVPVSAGTDGSLMVGDVTVTGGDTAEHALKNTYSTPKTEVSGTKTWKAPDSVTPPNTIDVKVVGKVGDVVKYEETHSVAPDSEGKWSVGDLIKYDGEDAIVYTATEVEPTGWKNSGSGTDFVNVITDTTTVSGTKTWEGDPAGTEHNNAEEVQLTLKRTSTKDGSSEETVTVGENQPTWQDGTYTFTDLDKYDSEGYEYEYTVSEAPVSGYSGEQDGNDFFNTRQTADLTITKQWNDYSNVDQKRPTADAFKGALNLFANGSEVTDTYASNLTVTDNRNGTYTATWAGLPEKVNGNSVTYSVTEDDIDGYTSTTTDPVTNGGTLVNNHMPTMDVNGNKVWDDDEAKATTTRPASVTVKLQSKAKDANEEAWGDVQDKTAELSGNNMSYSFTGLPKYADDDELVYRVVETNTPKGYEPISRMRCLPL